MRRLTFVLFALSALSVWTIQETIACQDSDTPHIKNGSFAEWENGLPVDWSVDIGATNGANAPLSEIKKGAGPSLQLSGNAKTRAWQTVSQSVDLKPGQTYQISYTAKSTGVKREGRQFDNCYVGLFSKSTVGKKLQPQFWPVTSKKFKPESHILTAPDNATFQLVIFLSKTGTLHVKDIKLRSFELSPKDSFDMLVKDMGRNYSFFEHKKIDWNELTERYRDRATAAQSRAEFTKIITEMLGELQDMHTWIMLDGKRIATFESSFDANYHYPTLKKDWENDAKRFGRLGLITSTKDGFCYLNVNALSGVSDQYVKAMTDEIKRRFDAKGFIVDIRRNGGGSEDIAKLIAGLFTDKQIDFAKSVYRNGDKPSDFGEPRTRSLQPTNNTTFEGPVVCLIGPGAVSSAEAFALMMKAIPNCTVVGQPTRGASGNPQPVLLPNGVEVWYSRWKSLSPDETCIEGVGVKPDIEVKHVPGTDTAYKKAVEILVDKTK